MAWLTYNIAGTTGTQELGDTTKNPSFAGNAANNWVINGATGADIGAANTYTIHANGQTAYGAYVYGGAASETIISNIAGATLSGGSGTDVLIGNGASNAWFVYDGTDNIYGNGAGAIATTSWNVTVDASAYGSALYLDLNTPGNKDAAGTQRTTGLVYGVNNVLGTAYADTIIANTTLAATLDGGAGADTLTGSAAGTKFIYDAADTVVGGAGTDILSAKNQTTGITLYMDATDSKFTKIETVEGSIGADDIRGGSNGTTGQTIYGFAGADALWAGAGAKNDILNGGKGNDTYWVGADQGADTVQFDGANNASDTVNFYNITAEDLIGNFDAAGITATATDIKFTTGTGTLTLTNAVGTSADRVKDFVSKEGWHFSVLAGAAADTTLTGGATTIDNIIATNVVAGAYIDGKGGNDNIWGGTGNDVIVYNVGDNIRGGLGNDTLTAAAATAGVNIYMEELNVKAVEDLTGSAYDDQLRGNTDAAGVVNGGDGNDALWGGAGTFADTLTGGRGADTYYFGTGEGNDIITAGTLASTGNALDTVNLYTEGLTKDNVAVALSGDNLVLTLNSGSLTNTLTLTNWNISDGNNKLNDFVIGEDHYTTDGTKLILKA